MFSCQHIKNISKKNGYYRPTFPDWHLIHALDISWWHQWHQWHLSSRPVIVTWHDPRNGRGHACPLTLPGRNTWYAASQQIVSKRSGQSQDVSRICSVFAKSIMNHCWNTLAGYLWIYIYIYGYLWISMDICYLRISGRWFPWPLVGGYVWHRVLIGCKRQVELSLQCILTEGKQLIHVNTMSFFQFHTLETVSRSAGMIAKADDWNARQGQYISLWPWFAFSSAAKKGRHEIKRPSILRICTATTTSARALTELPSHDDWEFQSSNWRPNMSVAMLWQQDAGSFGDFAVFLATCHISILSIHLADVSRISCRPVAKHSRSSTPCSRQQLSAPLRCHCKMLQGATVRFDTRFLCTMTRES